MSLVMVGYNEHQAISLPDLGVLLQLMDETFSQEAGNSWKVRLLFI